jgi:non-ribosomal peptide synthase protein (TIGR01720 family)
MSKGNYLAPQTETEKQLVNAWSEVLRAKQDEIGLESDFFALGGDSIKAIQIVARLRNNGLELKISDVMGSSGLSVMASKVRPLTRKIDQRPVEGEVMLSPIQLSFLGNVFARGSEANKDLFHQSFMLRFSEGITSTEVKIIVDKLLNHHDVLRMQYEKSAEGEWKQYNGGIDGDYYVFEELILPKGSTEKNKEIFFEEQGFMLKQRLGFWNRPLIGVGLYQDNEVNESHLLLSIHHMLIDLVSWRILFEDIEVLLDQLRSGYKLTLPEKTDSYRYWMNRNNEYSKSYLLNRQWQYWESQLTEQTDKIALQNPYGANTFGVSKELRCRLSEEEMRQVHRGMNGKNKIEMNALLLSALSRGLKDVFGVEKVRILLEGHGREEYLEQTDVNRTVGWFTSLYPFVLRHQQKGVESVLLLQDTLSQVPDKGAGYGLLRYYGENLLSEAKDIQLTFNYLGNFDRGESHENDNNSTKKIFSYSQYDHGVDAHSELERESEIEVNGLNRDGLMELSFRYSSERMSESAMHEFLSRYKLHILDICDALSNYERQIRLPGSFTYKGLELDQLALLEQEYGEIEDIYRLSPMQQGLYYHVLSEPDSQAYFEQFSYRMKGELDVEKLKQAYQILVDRHAALRTVFRNDLADEPLQVVLKKGKDRKSVV